MQVAPPPKSAPGGAFSAFQRGAAKLGRRPPPPMATLSPRPAEKKWRVPSEIDAASVLVAVTRGFTARAALGHAWQREGRGGRFIEDLYSPEDLKAQWAAAVALVAADPATAGLAASEPDDLSEFLRSTSSEGAAAAAGDAASAALVQVWLDIAQNHRVGVLARQVARRCGVSTDEAQSVVHEIAEIAVSSAYHTVRYASLESCVSRTDEDGVLEALRASTVETVWTDVEDFAWRSVLPLLSK